MRPHPKFPMRPLLFRGQLGACLGAFLCLGLCVAAAASDDPPRWPQMPYLVTDPGPEYAAENRMFVLAGGGIEVAPNGRLWATWFSGGTGEGWHNYTLLATSDDDGATWSGPQLVVDPPFRASSSNLWLDPDGRLWFFFNTWPIRQTGQNRNEMSERFDDIASYNAFMRENQGHGSQLWAMTSDDPGAPSPEWNPPRVIATEHSLLNKPTVLSDGTWVLPTGSMVREEDSSKRKPIRPLFSEDGGKSFHYRGIVPMADEDWNAWELQIVERSDGSLWLLNRTKYGIGESFSYDQGHTWTPMQPSDIAHPVARFYIGRLDSGKLLLIKHGRLDEKSGKWFGGRERLLAFLSDDDGETWSGGLMIDERKQVSYPDATQAEDGTIYVLYDRERHHAKEMLMAAFTEADVAAGEPVSGVARFRQLVDKALKPNPLFEEQEATPQWKLDTGRIRENEDGAALRIRPAGAFETEDAEVAAFRQGARLFQDRKYTLRQIPNELDKARFVRLPLEGDKTLTCAKPGMLFFLTPLTERSPSWSRSKQLVDQGFEKVALPEFLLFGRREHDHVSLYQKRCEAGETIEVGKWAVPIFFE